jgi:hypothetical protein
MNEPEQSAELAARHMRIGWWALLAFLSLGIALETLHGFKVGYYLDVSNETRRLTWRLAHAHGALLSLINIAFGLTLRSFDAAGKTAKRAGSASLALVLSTLLLPLGFFLGGLFTHAGDPGLGIVLVPIGAVALFFAVFKAARMLG